MNGAESPLEISRATLCEREVSLKMDHESAVAHVRSTFEDVGFRAVTEYSPSVRFGHATNAIPGSHTVLGFEIPNAEDRGLATADERIAVLYPLSVSIRSDEPDVQRVYYLDVLRLAPGLNLTTDEERWLGVVAELEGLIYDAFDALEADIDHL